MMTSCIVYAVVMQERLYQDSGISAWTKLVYYQVDDDIINAVSLFVSFRRRSVIVVHQDLPLRLAFTYHEFDLHLQADYIIRSVRVQMKSGWMSFGVSARLHVGHLPWWWIAPRMQPSQKTWPQIAEVTSVMGLRQTAQVFPGIELGASVTLSYCISFVSAPSSSPPTSVAPWASFFLFSSALRLAQ